VARVQGGRDEAALHRIECARAAVRRYVWQILTDRSEGFPEVVVDGVELSGWTVIDTDGSLVSAPSDVRTFHRIQALPAPT
jgi:hypothetical protein